MIIINIIIIINDAGSDSDSDDDDGDVIVAADDYDGREQGHDNGHDDFHNDNDGDMVMDDETSGSPARRTTRLDSMSPVEPLGSGM